MEIITVESLSFTYAGEERAALSKLSFSVDSGEFIVLFGPSGCGKSTLLRHLKREIVPAGKRAGRITYAGEPLETLSAARAAADIGMVFQNPESQLVMDTVWNELAFSMENLGWDVAVMRKRLAEMASFFGLEPLLHQSVHDLSGGQKQMLNLASVLLLQPKVLLLDEPTSQLDPVSAKEFIDVVVRINRELSTAIIMSEQRLEEVLPLADRVIMMEEGRIKYDGSPRAVALNMMNDAKDEPFVPAVARLFSLAKNCRDRRDAAAMAGQLPLTVREGRKWLSSADSLRIVRNGNDAECNDVPVTAERSDVVLRCQDVTFRYVKDRPNVLSRLSMTLYKGEIVTIMGGNGAGKSTLLQMMAGLLKPQGGKVTGSKEGKVGYLSQNPLLHFSFDTVREELFYAAEAAGMSKAEAESEASRWLEAFSLQKLAAKHPHDISGGQQQKVALAMALIARPDILLIDEPTKGLDPIAKREMVQLLGRLSTKGVTIAAVTHDVEFAAQAATRCVLLFDGGITAEAEPGEFFGGNYFYTTVINRVVRDWLPDALTCEDVIELCPDLDQAPVRGSL